MKKFLLVSAFFLSQPIQAEKWTQNQYIQEVLKQSPELKKAEEETLQGSSRKKAALAEGWLPAVNADARVYPYGQNPQNSYKFTKWKTDSDDISYNANVSLNLFNNLKDYWAIKLAGLGYKTALQERASTKNQAALKAIETFHDLILKTQNLTVIKKDFEMRQDQFELTKGLYKQGMKSLFDLQKTEVDFYSSELRVLSIQNEEKKAKARFNLLVNRPLEETVEIANNPAPLEQKIPSFDDSLKTALEARPDWLAARFRADQARVDVRKKGQDLFPALNVKGDWNWQNRASFGLPSERFGIPKTNYQVSAVLSYQFGLGHVPQWQEFTIARSRLKQAQAAQDELERRVKEEVFAGVLELERLQKTLAVVAKQIAIVKESAGYTQDRYRQGSAGIWELTQAQQDLLSAQLEEAAALKEYHLSLARYRIAIGQNVGSKE
ncbi:MAG: TolC family protein [Elusimicrobia bacterium]|nr:TolC family protein [Elusimicrobiota bacterium]